MSENIPNPNQEVREGESFSNLVPDTGDNSAVYGSPFFTNNLDFSAINSNNWCVIHCRVLSRRIVDLEEHFGLYQFAFWPVASHRAIAILCTLFAEFSGQFLDPVNLSVVRELDNFRNGVLIRVNSLELKRKIFNYEYLFKLRRFNLDIV